MYQASASFQQTCLQQMQTLNATVGEACHEVVGQALEKPRTWREYFAKGAQLIKRGMPNVDDLLSSGGWQLSGISKSRTTCDEAVYNEKESMRKNREILESLESDPVPPGFGRFWRCTQESSYSGRPRPPIDYVCWAASAEHGPKLEVKKESDVVDWHDVEVDHECIKMQGDASVMYGGMPSYNLLGSIVYENVSTLNCERYGDFVGDGLGALNGWGGSLDSDKLALRRAQETRMLFHVVHDPRQWKYLSWPRLVWNITGWDIEDMRVVEGLAVTLIVTMVGYMIMRRKTAC